MLKTFRAMEVLIIEETKEVESSIAVEDDGTVTFLKEKKRRRVSFANTDTVHVIPRNDDIETPPVLLNVDPLSMKQNTPLPSELSIAGVPASQPADPEFLAASHLHENSADFSQFTCDMDTSNGSWADEDFTTRKNSFDGFEDDSGCFVHIGHISCLEDDDSIVNDVMNDDMTMDATTFSRNLSHYLKSGTTFGLQGTDLLGKVVSHKNANDSDARSSEDDSMALTKPGAPHWALVNPQDISMRADDEQSDMSLASGFRGQVASQKTVNDIDSQSEDDRMAFSKPGPPDWALVSPHDVSIHADDDQSDMSIPTGTVSNTTVPISDSQSEDDRMAFSKPRPPNWALVSPQDVSMHADDDQSDMSFPTGTVSNTTVPICNLKDLLLNHTDYTITRKLSREIDVSTSKILDSPSSKKEIIVESKQKASSENANQILFVRGAMKSKSTDADSAAGEEAIEEVYSAKQRSSGFEEHAMKSKPVDADSAAGEEPMEEVASTVQQEKQQYSAKQQSSGIEEHAMKSKSTDAGKEAVDEIDTTVQPASQKLNANQHYSAKQRSSGIEEHAMKSKSTDADSTAGKEATEMVATTVQQASQKSNAKQQYSAKPRSSGIEEMAMKSKSTDANSTAGKETVEEVATTVQRASQRSNAKQQYGAKQESSRIEEHAVKVLRDSNISTPVVVVEQRSSQLKGGNGNVLEKKPVLMEVKKPNKVQQLLESSLQRVAVEPRSLSKGQQSYKAKARRPVLADSTNLLDLPKDNVQEDRKFFKASSQGFRTAMSSKASTCAGISGGIGKDPRPKGLRCLEDILQCLEGKTLHGDDHGGEEDMVPLFPTKLQTLGDYLQFSCGVQPQMDWLREHVQESEAKLQAAKKRNADIKSFAQKLPEESTLIFKTKFASKCSLAKKGWLLWKMKPEMQILTWLQESKDNLIKEVEAVHGKNQQVLQLKEQVLHMTDLCEEMKNVLEKHHHHYQDARERLRVSKDKWNKIQTKIQSITSVYVHTMQLEADSFEVSFEKNLEALIQRLLFTNSLLQQQQVMQSTLKSTGGKSLIDFSLEGMCSQSFQFEGDSPLAQVKLFRTLHPEAIEMAFPCMDASLFFQYINSGLYSIASVQMKQVYQIIQRTNCLFGCLMDVLKEIRYCRRNFGISCKFQMQKDKLLLNVAFLRCTSGLKMTLMFDMVCVKEGMYPSDLKPADIRIETYGLPLNGFMTRREVLARIAKIQPGFAKLHRICSCVEELMRTVQETA